VTIVNKSGSLDLLELPLLLLLLLLLLIAVVLLLLVVVVVVLVVLLLSRLSNESFVYPHEPSIPP
jgi:hypothetical protein